MQESAAELVSHFAEHQPGQAMDIAAAVVETVPGAASEIVEILNDAKEIKDSDLVSPINNKP